MKSITHGANLRGHGEMGALLRIFDWSSTELGSPASWLDSLTIATSICLNSQFPMALWWGRRTYTMIYNDADRSVLGRTRHPRWFGRCGRECWREIWDTVGPLIDSVFETAERAWSEDMPLSIDRNLPCEEAYFTFSCSAIYEERDRVGGVLAACTETTDRVLSERRLGVLRELGARASEARTPEQACEIALHALDAARHSVAFALFYLVENRCARLVAASPHLERRFAPELVPLKGADVSPWRLARIAASGVAEVIEDVFERVGPLPGGIWPEPTRSALVLPLKGPGELGLAGLLVAGATPRRVVDAGYRMFFDCVAAHAATAIANARAYEHERRRAPVAAVAEPEQWLLDPVKASDSLSLDADEVRRVETRDVGAPRADVLVVDDNAAVCAYVARLLKDECDVRTATNGAVALRMARERVPNLVLADVVMPRLDGVELLRALREDPRTCMVTVILISARVGEESRAEGFENGADDYLMKPFIAHGKIQLQRTRQDCRQLAAEATDMVPPRWSVTSRCRWKRPTRSSS